MLFYGQRKRVWKTSFWRWKGDAASIMPGPYSLTVTILHQIKRWQFSRQRVLKYVSISFEDDIRDTSRIYAWRHGAGTTQELWCWLSMTKQFVFGGDGIPGASPKKSLRCTNAAGRIKNILLSSKTLQEINKHLPTTESLVLDSFYIQKPREKIDVENTRFLANYNWRHHQLVVLGLLHLRSRLPSPPASELHLPGRCGDARRQRGKVPRVA